MAEKTVCPKCGAPSSVEGHKTIPHLATLKCPKCGELNVAAESSEKEKATKKKGKDE
ncbi:MAG: hypothetical protein ACREDF_09770 [Thermoplasmata archaeon]